MPIRCQLLPFLVLAAAGPCQVTSSSQPDLAAIDLPVLAAARDRPEALWQFLTDPETPYAHAFAAANRCREVFALSLLRPLMRARAELHREHMLHWFGHEEPRGSPGGLPRTDFARERRLLGRSFTLPATRLPYPDTWQEAEQAAWPWRVMRVLDHTLPVIAPGGTPGELPRTLAWFAECLTWPIDADEDASMFVEATSAAAFTKTLPVLARWRRLMLDPNTPQAGLRAANALGGSHRNLLWGDAEARLACQLIAADGLQQSPHKRVRHECAFGLHLLSVTCASANPSMTATRAPLPVEAVIAAADLAVAPAPAPADAWTNLYAWAFSVCEAVERPPFTVNRSIKWDGIEVRERLAGFARWWQEHRPALAVEARQRADVVADLRARLETMAR